MSRDPRKDRLAKRRRRQRFEAWNTTGPRVDPATGRRVPRRDIIRLLQLGIAKIECLADYLKAAYPRDELAELAYSPFPAGLGLPDRPAGLNR